MYYAENDVGQGGVSVGVASQEGCGVLEHIQVGLEDEDIENHYHLLGSEVQEEHSRQELRDEDIENHYYILGENEMNGHLRDKNYLPIHEQQKSTSQENIGIESDYYLLDNVEDAAEQEREESVYHVLEMPGNDDNDYEDPDEGNLFQDYDQQKRERVNT